MKKPLILVVNDDGITAPGIRTLIEIMKEVGEVIVVAPDKAQSGMGHAVTIHSTLRIHKMDMGSGCEEYSCTGTPVDSVKFAVGKILKRKPDLCVSGINHGSNASINVIYSGTMSAAVEGAIEGIPSVGYSLCNYAINADFNPIKKYVKKIAENVLKHGLPDGVCLNVNLPAVPEEEIKGIKICRQAKAMWTEQFDERQDPGGKTYYWLTGKFLNKDRGEDTDLWALKNNFISVVPVQFDITAHHAIHSVSKWDF
jgi:5'-nucleotidase